MAQYLPPEDLRVGNGTETVFGFTFPYLRVQDIAITVDGVATPVVLVGTSQVSINPAPINGAKIRIYRNTPAQFPQYLFAGGVPMLPRYIDDNNRQLLYTLQEGLTDFTAVAGVADAAAASAAEAAEAAAEAVASAAASAQLVQTSLARTLRVPLGDPTIPGLPAVSIRANKLLGFDALGNPLAYLPASGSGTELALALADPDNGANIVAARLWGTGVPTTVQSYLSRNDEAIQTLDATTGKQVNTLADVRLLNGTRVKTVTTRGHTSIGDGGHTTFDFIGSDITSVDDNATTIKGPGPGTWRARHSGHMRPEQAGGFADGASDATAAFNALLRAGIVIFGDYKQYLVSTVLTQNGSVLGRVSLKCIGWVGAGAGAHHQPVICMDGTVTPKVGLGLYEVGVDGSRERLTNITFDFGEDGGMHGLALRGACTKIMIDHCVFNNCGTAGIALHHPTPSGTVNEFKITEVTIKDTAMNDNREHGMFGDALYSLRVIRCMMHRNGLDKDETKPREHGLRGATVLIDGAVKYFGSGYDLEGYTVGSPIGEVLFEDCSCLNNATTGGLIYDPTPANAPGFVPRRAVTVRGGEYDSGLKPTSQTLSGENAALRILGNSQEGRRSYAQVIVEGVRFSGGAPEYRDISVVSMSGGFANTVGYCAKVYFCDHDTITSPGLSSAVHRLSNPLTPVVKADPARPGGTAVLAPEAWTLVRTLPDGSYVMRSGCGITSISAPLRLNITSPFPAEYRITGIQACAIRTSTIGSVVPVHYRIVREQAADVSIDNVTDVFRVDYEIVISPCLGLTLPT